MGRSEPCRPGPTSLLWLTCAGTLDRASGLHRLTKAVEAFAGKLDRVTKAVEDLRGSHLCASTERSHLRESDGCDGSDYPVVMPKSGAQRQREYRERKWKARLAGTRGMGSPPRGSGTTVCPTARQLLAWSETAVQRARQHPVRPTDGCVRTRPGLRPLSVDVQSVLEGQASNWPGTCGGPSLLTSYRSRGRRDPSRGSATARALLG